MRLYTFTNMYLSAIQKGIQSAHLTHEIMQKYSNAKSDTQVWAKDHKTMIVLDGGYSSNLANLGEVLASSGYETVGWAESEDALGGALTCVGITLPEKIYNLAQYARQGVADIQKVEIEDDDSDDVTEADLSFVAVPTEQYSKEEELITQLEAYGEYTEPEVILINELNKYRLAV